MWGLLIRNWCLWWQEEWGGSWCWEWVKFIICQSIHPFNFFLVQCGRKMKRYVGKWCELSTTLEFSTHYLITFNNGDAVRDDDDDVGVHVSWPRPENLSQNSLFFLTEASITALLVASLDELAQDTYCAGQRTKRTKQDEEYCRILLYCSVLPY